MTEPAELPRLDELLAKHGLAKYRDHILAQGSPCISVALIDPPAVPEPDLPPVPVGASKVGGDPDLPPGLTWPEGPEGRAGFFLQISLADLPPTPWNPLPAKGLLSLFCHDDCRAYWDPPGWEVVWSEGDPAALRRVARDPALLSPEMAERGFFADSVARPLTFRAGTEFPPGSSGDWDWLNDFERKTRADDPDVLDRFFEFALHAADPGREADMARKRGPFFHPIGCLLGHTDRSICEGLTLAASGRSERHDDREWRRANRAELAREGAAWRQFMRIASNPATRYMGPSDAAPIFLMARDGGDRPWKPAGPIPGLG